MAIEFKSPTQVADEYLLHLKSLKPEINTEQTDSDWWIKSQVLGGVISGAYSDQRAVANDAFPQSARREAVEKHLETYFDSGFTQPTKSNGFALFKSTDGSTGQTAAAGTLELVYNPNGNTYTNTEDILIDSPTGSPFLIQSIGTGQDQNLLEGTELTISSVPTGFNSIATVFDGPLADGRDVETTQEAAERVLLRIREPIRGGTKIDYEQWALEADDAVTSVNILRYPQGFGSVGVIVAAGTTNIDEAIDNGDPIVLIPSSVLLETVYNYIETQRPLTDYVIVYSPVETLVDVTVNVRYSQGDGTTILDGQTLTQEELVIREVKRAIYKTPAGGRRIGASGFVLASEIEETIDVKLSNTTIVTGEIPMLSDRQVEDLTSSGVNRTILVNEIAIPGNITVVEL